MKTQIQSKILAIAIAAMIGLATTGDCRPCARRRSHGWRASDFQGGPYMGGVISTPPTFNPSSGYTVPTSPEAPVSPA